MTLIWSGESKSLTNVASGGKIVTERYRVTSEYIYVETGLLGSKGEQIPMWAVRDLDTNQSLIQKARGLGDLVIHCEHNDYTGRRSFTLASIENFRELRDQIAGIAQDARLNHQRLQQTQHVNYSGAPFTGGLLAQTQDAGQPESDPLAKLERLGDLLSKGLLTQDEFEAQKKKLLGLD